MSRCEDEGAGKRWWSWLTSRLVERRLDVGLAAGGMAVWVWLLMPATKPGQFPWTAYLLIASTVFGVGLCVVSARRGRPFLPGALVVLLGALISSLHNCTGLPLTPIL